MEKGLPLYFLFLLLILGVELRASESLNPPKRVTRIESFLPGFSQPPSVEPFLPEDFVLGKQKDDPHFIQGYFWGNEKIIRSYFDDSSSLNGCLIRAQVSSNVTQIGLDRFSSDGKINDLTAVGFTEIMVRRGKWGIFPFREMHARGPKGRHYYQLWVGLNNKNGKTIYFQLLYPEYLNEPTQSQKKIWNDFVKKTSFLNFQDLLLLHGPKEAKTGNKRFEFLVEKRVIDGKFSIWAVPLKTKVKLEIREIKDYTLIQSHFKKPYLEIRAHILEEDNSYLEVLPILYKRVENFTFDTELLYPKKLQSHPNYFFLLKPVVDKT